MMVYHAVITRALDSLMYACDMCSIGRFLTCQGACSKQIPADGIRHMHQQFAHTHSCHSCPKSKLMSLTSDPADQRYIWHGQLASCIRTGSSISPRGATRLRNETCGYRLQLCAILISSTLSLVLLHQQLIDLPLGSSAAIT